MPLALDIITEDQWKASRNTPLQKSKWFNSHWVTDLKKILFPLRFQYDGHFSYFNVKEVYTHKRSLSVCESSPVFQLFNLYSNTFTNNIHFNQLDYWKSSSIDPNIVDKLKMYNLNKYDVGDETKFDYQNYILFPIQSLERHFNLEMFIDAVKWSLSNKKLLVVKLHPFTTTDNYIFPVIKNLKSAGMLDYVKIVTHKHNIDTLIDQADQVWLFNSGVALNAILRGKPVSMFMNSYYSPLCKRCYSPQEAFANNIIDEEMTCQYLSWFYHRLTIDIGNDTATDRFIEVFDHFYKDRQPLELYLNRDWK